MSMLTQLTAPVHDAMLGTLACITSHLMELTLGETYDRGDDTRDATWIHPVIDVTCFAVIQHMTSLQYLHIGITLSDAHVMLLATCTSLTSLTLILDGLSDAAFAACGHITSLTSLIFHRMEHADDVVTRLPLTDACLTNIRTCHALTELSTELLNSITFEGAASCTWAHLTSITIHASMLTDAGLMCMLHACRNITALHITGTHHLTRDALHVLASWHGHTQVTALTLESAGTWDLHDLHTLFTSTSWPSLVHIRVTLVSTDTDEPSFTRYCFTQHHIITWMRHVTTCTHLTYCSAGHHVEATCTREDVSALMPATITSASDHQHPS